MRRRTSLYAALVILSSALAACNSAGSVAPKGDDCSGYIDMSGKCVPCGEQGCP